MIVLKGLYARNRSPWNLQLDGDPLHDFVWPREKLRPRKTGGGEELAANPLRVLQRVVAKKSCNAVFFRATHDPSCRVHNISVVIGLRTR